MPAYNFRSEFAAMVETGEKPHTIRKRRRRPTVVSDPLYLYTGQRTKVSRLLRVETCTAVRSIDIYLDGVRLDGRSLCAGELERLAWRDGFDGLEAFFAFFEKMYGLPLIGEMELIEWAP